MSERPPDQHSDVGVRLLVLGPLEAHLGHTQVVLGGPKQTALLALLAAAGSHGATVDSLIEGLYGSDRSRGSKAAVHTYVSRLRSTLGDVVVRRGDVYCLELDRWAIDASEFEFLVTEGSNLVESDPEAGAAALRRALELWRGHAYSGIEAGHTIDAEVARLDELRLLCLQHRIDAELSLGLDRALVGELDALVVSHPYNERFTAQHMLALYRTNRQTEALRSFQRTRHTLQSDLGVEPSPDLVRLEAMILSHDTSLALAASPALEHVTVVATDLADAAALAPVDRDDQLEARDAKLGGLIAETGGTIADIKQTSAFATLPDASSAVQVAESMARDGHRIAVDEGLVETTPAGVAGPPLVRAARLLAVGHAGQVLVSEQAHQQLASSGSTGWTMTSLGRHNLRGVDESLVIYQVAIDGQFRSFPSLQTDRLPLALPGSRTVVPGYEIRDLLNDDGHSVVHLGYQHSAGRLVQIRSFSADILAAPGFVRRFEAEMARTASIHHANVVPIIDFWRDHESAAVITQPAPTNTLADRLIGAKSVDADEALAILHPVAAALDYAHSTGVIHGALTPSRVRLADSGPMLDGLGLTHVIGDLATHQVTQYRAPETQGRNPTSAADVFSVGALARTMLLQPPSEHPSSDAMDDIIATATDTDPDRRYPSAVEVVERLERSLNGRAAARRRPARNPYKGLRPFGESDARDFFGRVDEIAAIKDAVDTNPITVVVGPSGIGKSSLIRAGLLPALKSGPEADRWLGTDMVPGTDPFASLGKALSRISVQPPSTHLESFRTSEIGLEELVTRITGSTRSVLVIDQFEELYTTTSPAEATAFMGQLARHGDITDSAVRVVIAIRADFLDRPLNDANFGGIVRDHTVIIPKMTVAEIIDAVVGPAERVGVNVEASLAAELARDTAAEPGGIPLLQYTLAQLFDRCSPEDLTIDSYRELGGLAGAIARRAEDHYSTLSEPAKRYALDVFTRLITLSSDGPTTRRRVRLNELQKLPGASRSAREVLDGFGDARLLTFDHDPVSREPTMSLAHEAILTEWPRLRDWVTDLRIDIQTRDRLTDDALEWEQSQRSESALQAGQRLVQSEKLQDDSPLALGPAEITYISASRAAEDARTQRATRTRRLVMATLSIALMIAAALATVAYVQRNRANQQAQESRVAELVGETRLAIDNEDPQLGLLLALEAAAAAQGLDHTASMGVNEAMLAAVHNSKLAWISPHGNFELAASPDGSQIITTHQNDLTAAVLVAASDGTELLTTDFGERISGFEFSPDGTMIAITMQHPDDPFTSLRTTGGVIVDAETLDIVAQLRTTDQQWIPQWTADGNLVTGSTDGVYLWDTSTGERLTVISDRAAQYHQTIPGTNDIALARDQQIHFVDASTGDTRRVETPPVQGGGLRFSNDGQHLAIAAWPNRQVAFVDVDTWKTEAIIDHASPTASRYSPDGRWFAVGGNTDIITVRDNHTGDTIELRGHGQGLFNLYFAGNNHLVAVLIDGGLRAWQLEPHDLNNDAAITIGGSLRFQRRRSIGPAIDIGYLTPEGPLTLATLDPDTSQITTLGNFHPANWFEPIVANDGATYAGVSTTDGLGRIYDTTTREPTTTFRRCEIPKLLDNTTNRAVLAAACLERDQNEQLADARQGIIDLTTGQLIGPIDGPGIAYATQGPANTPSRNLAVMHQFPTVLFADLTTGATLGAWTPPDEYNPLTIAIDPAGESAAIGGQSGDVVIFDLTAILDGTDPADAIMLYLAQASTGPTHWTVLTNDRLITSGGGTQIRTWTLDGELLDDYQTAADSASTVAPLPDGTGILYEDHNGTLRYLPYNPQTIHDLAQQRLLRGYTPQECATYLEPADCNDQP